MKKFKKITDYLLWGAVFIFWFVTRDVFICLPLILLSIWFDIIGIKNK